MKCLKNRPGLTGEDFNNFGKYFTCEHKGGLYESMRTERCITLDTFKRLLNSGLYEFYAYDERIESDVYILKDMSNNLGLPVWLHYSKEKRVCGFLDDRLYKKYK